MYVCICKGITDHQIRSAVTDGATSIGQLRRELGVASQCGKCSCLTREIVQEALSDSAPSAESLFYSAVA
jgi:bacterioferritin-associated ferredoxin